LNDEKLVLYLHAPIYEARAALDTLTDSGLVTPNRTRYALTDAGQSKAKECWSNSEAHAKETFENSSATQVATFNEVIRQIISY
jgi:DNA-binding MarR family transcriptional regulator